MSVVGLSSNNLQKKGTQLRLLNDISTKLQSLLESENFYQEIVDIIQSRFNYYSVNIWSVDSQRSATLKGQSGAAYSAHLQIGSQLKDEGILGHVIRTKKSYISNDITKDPIFTSLSIPVQTLSELCIPVLSADGIVLATLNVESDQSQAFDEDDLITMEAVASQVAVAITNRNLYSEAKQFSAKLQQVVEDKTLELRKANERILEQQKLLQKENTALKTLVHHDQKGMDPVGKSPAITNILGMVDKIAPTQATVLIQGESGTGKELIARRLHQRSERSDKPFVTVNCGALQESLLESELFGHEKGAFTGAVSQKLGLAETADGGTIFLDEIGEMSLSIQAKLLRFLQEGEFYRVGGKRPIRVNVRVISATNRDLEQEVKESRFREDLFYRLNTITLRMPPLRERKEDIPLLVDYFLKNSRYGGTALHIRKIDARVYDVFQNYSWPGNIRELQNTIERLKILAEGNEIKLDDIPFSMRMPKTKSQDQEYSTDLSLDEVEKSHILRTLSRFHGNKTKTAQNLGITIKTLYNKLHRYGIIPSTSETEMRD